jgi:hypothetical protein
LLSSSGAANRESDSSFARANNTRDQDGSCFSRPAKRCT